MKTGAGAAALLLAAGLAFTSPADELRHRHVVRERAPEIPGQQPAEPVQVAERRRL
ncbi:hypothetical protein GXW71_34170, partial [Roseomonas hellenica]|nr:hypothetical protein [Plastoroseomonas hellenica]